MSLRSPTIQKWWPSTQSLDLVEGSVEHVAEAVRAEISRFWRRFGFSEGWQAFRDLDGVFRSAAEFANVPTVVAVLPTHSRWTVLWNNSFLCNGYDSLCACLTGNHGLATVHWSAHDEWTSEQSGAVFIHRKLVGGTLAERTVQAAQEDKRWHFHAIGEPLPEEDLEAHANRRKRDRINEEIMAAFLSRMGATPWQESFYALPSMNAYVLRRQDRTPTIIRRMIADVIG